MNPYIEKYKEHLKLFPREGEDFSSVLDVLHYYFALEHSVDNGAIRAGFGDAGGILEKMSFEDNNRIFGAIVHLCEEHAKQGFMEGIRVGISLALELDI